MRQGGRPTHPAPAEPGISGIETQTTREALTAALNEVHARGYTACCQRNGFGGCCGYYVRVYTYADKQLINDLEAALAALAEGENT